MPDHVVVVIEENHSYSEIIGSPSAPYINQLARSGASFTNSHGIEHPSQPNYLDIFSGSNQGVTADLGVSGLGARWPFTTPNLGAQLLAAGKTFIGYSESMPSVGYTGDGDLSPSQDNYRAKHNPWVMWQNDHPTSPNQLPSSVNRPFSDFPSDYSKLPTVSFVVPNEQNDMHSNTVPRADTWLHDNLDGYVQWAKSNNSLLIVTFDEDDGSQGNRIPTLFIGPMVNPGQYADSIDHYSLLRTLEDMYGLGNQGYLGGAANRDAIASPFVPEPATVLLLPIAGVALLVATRRASSPAT
ncbi:MAG TPA: alkaline phosphatase family protein [Gemmataceae bacterium]|nr:alkaline phosphatase family protein [Gemmataceae bacterium]